MFRIMLFGKHVAKVHGQIILTISTHLLLIRVQPWFVLHCVFVSVIVTAHQTCCCFECLIYLEILPFELAMVKSFALLLESQ